MKILFTLIALLAAPTFAAVQTGEPAPDFTAQTASGETVKLSDYQGQPVVLEWTNHGCPFVKKFYKGGDMQGFQQKAVADGAVWLRVISSAEGKQGHLSAEEALAQADEMEMAATHTLIDASGDIGRMYDAKTTPHMFVIERQGMLAYQGAIDSNPSTDSADIDEATNYVMAALDAIKLGNMPAVQETKAYGCSVKY